MANIQESYPTQTTGLGVAANILVAGNNGATVKATVPGYNDVTLSVTSVSPYSNTFQLNPQIVDASGASVAPGTAFVISSVASGTGVYTGTIGVKANSLVGQTFVVTGFVAPYLANNGTFICTANNGTTTITLDNPNSVSVSAAGVATSQESSDDVFVVSAAGNGNGVYTGTFGVATNSLIGKTVKITGFVTAPSNNGTFTITANNGSTTITTANVTTTESASATATVEPQVVELTYVAYPAKTNTGGTYLPVNGGAEAVATVSASGLITAVAPGGVEVEVSYPTFDNTSGTTGNTFAGTLPLNKIYATVNVTVIP